ncbi:hypothetical protein B0H14DRAFT_2632167 [Mycena olivaceomarginata]|nr:hypothetical protein B0H14DRAFT_2632167 [Mycena olivaceomarginata]
MMMPKLYSVETMLGFYLKVYACGLKPNATKPFSFMLKSIFNIAESTMNINLGLPLSSSVFPPRPALARSQPNYFRRSQVELDLVYPATTSPNPDSTSARRIEIHFNFNLELNYSKLKLDVPGTRLITSQVMLNYHTNRRVGDLEVKVGAF